MSFQPNAGTPSWTDGAPPSHNTTNYATVAGQPLTGYEMHPNQNINTLGTAGYNTRAPHLDPNVDASGRPQARPIYRQGRGPSEHHGHSEQPVYAYQGHSTIVPPPTRQSTFPPPPPPPPPAPARPAPSMQPSSHGNESDDDLPPPSKIFESKGKSKAKTTDKKPKPEPKPDPRTVKVTLGKRKASGSGGSGGGGGGGGGGNPKKKGRQAGSMNYSDEDLDALLHILETALPLGGRAWNLAADEFNKWARENGRPERTNKSLEAKFKQLVKTTKPTGDAECPPHVEWAHRIDELMNEKAGTRDLDDDDILDASEDEVIELTDSDDHDDPPAPAAAVKAKATVQPRPRTRNQIGQDLLSNISNSLDPSSRAARAEQSGIHSLFTTQLLMLNSQLRELQRQQDNLRSRLSESEERRAAAERRLERYELLRMLSANPSSLNPSTTSRDDAFVWSSPGAGGSTGSGTASSSGSGMGAPSPSPPTAPDDHDT